MTIFRRTLLLWLLMFWQGGFLFYGAIVVTIGSIELESDFKQGMITRRVTDCLNLTGVIVLLAWTWDLLAERDTRLARRWGAWIFLMATLAALAWLHVRMEAFIGDSMLLDHDLFHHLHRWYLRVSTAQWFVCILFTVWTLQNWRAADRSPLSPSGASGMENS